MVQGSGLVRPETSPSDHEDGTPLDGASIGNAAHSRSASSTGAFTQHDANTPVLKIKVRGVRLDSAATGAPVITAPNVFRVPAVLGVDLSGIADSNGVTNIADSATYTWQRFAANGTTLEAANIGTGDTYTLTDADAGKKVKVSVIFQDDDNYGEGPLTSAATAAITAAATCAAPTYVGGAAEIWTGKLTVGQNSIGADWGFSKAQGYGSLDNATFMTAASNNYEIIDASEGTGLRMAFDAALSAAEKQTLVLHICDQPFHFSSSTIPVMGAHRFSLPFNTYYFRDYAERTIYLSQDTAAPTFVEATVNGTSLVITFNEALGAAASLANGAFTVKKGSGGTTQTLSSTAPSISGRTVTLTLATASAVTATDTDVKVLYTKPTTGTANKLVDSFGNEATTFTADQDVINELADQVPPELSRDRSRVLVSNIGQDSDDTPDSGDKAQPFRTGANPAGYTVKSIEMQTNAGVNTSSFPAVTLRSGSATGTLVGTPAKPSSSPASGVLTYTFDTPVPLDASTTYWVVTGPTVSVSWWSAASDATDATTASGWTIPGKGQHKSGASFVDFAGNAYLQLQINGVRVDPAVTDAAVLAADGLTLTLTYNEPLKTASVPDKSAFTVEATPAGGSEADVALASSGVTVSGSTVVLKLAVPIAHNDGSVKVSYAKPGTGAVIEDANGNDAAGFTDQPVTNNSTVPRVSIERLYADASPGIADPAFRVRRSNSGGALTVNIGITQAAAYLSSTTRTITIPGGARYTRATFRSSYRGNTSGDLTATVVAGSGYVPAVAPDNSATVQMKVPASGPTVWVSHQHLNVTVNESDGTADLGVVFSTGAGVAKPRISEITIAALTDQGTASINRDYQHISKNLPVGVGDWRAVAGGSYSHTEPLPIKIFDDDQYERTDETFVVYLRRAHGVTSVLDIPDRNDPDGTATVTIVDDTPDTLKVSSVEVTSTPTNMYYGATDTIEFTVTFTGTVTVTGAPQFAFDLGGAIRQVAYTSGSGSQEIVFSHTVVATDGDDHDGISWAADSLSLNGGTIKFTHTDVAEQVDADLDHAAQAALPGHKVEAAKPAFVEASVNGTALTVTFSEELDTTAAPANSAFTVKKGSGGTAQTLSSTAPSISGRTVTLTLATASAVTATDTDVKVAYTKPSANPLKDLSGKEADTFADQDVTNALADQVPPVLAVTDAAVLAADGVTLTLTYNEPLKTSSVPAVAAFTVEATPAGGSEAVVALASSGVTVSGSTVVLKLAVPITHNDSSVKVSYEKPGTGAVIEDANGNDAADFTDRAVTNNSTAPRVSIERVYADASSLIANPVFRIRRSNTGTALLDVELSLTQTDMYVDLSDTSTVIASGQTEKEFIVDLNYPGNTNGDLTVTVTEGVGYAPALAPNDAATVAIKAPAAGRPLTVVHDQADWTVDEGDNARVTMTLTLAGGLADPRDDYDLFIDLETGTATAQAPGGSGGDFIVPATGARTPVLASGWTASGGGFTQTVTLDIETVEDTDPEGEEEFRAVFNVSNEDGALEFPALPDPNADPTPPNNRRSTITIRDDDPLVVTDVKVSSTPTASYYGVGDTIKFTVTFNGAVSVTGMPQFAFDLAGQTRQAAYTGEDEDAAQTFEYTVASTDADDHDGISWGANAVGLNGGTIALFVKDGTPPDADLDHAAQAALPGQKVDAEKPRLDEAEVDGVTLSMFFSEDLNTTAPANTAFEVKVDGGTGANPTAVSISGSVVTLTLATAVTQDQTVTVSYTSPASNKIKDLSGKEADSFTDRTVDPPPTSPTSAPRPATGASRWSGTTPATARSSATSTAS